MIGNRLLGLLILLAAAPSDVSTPVLDGMSARSVPELNACFSSAQERTGSAWAFLPAEHGGTFTDSGARGAAPSYWLQVQDAGTATHLRLFAAAGSPVIKAVMQCR